MAKLAEAWQFDRRVRHLLEVAMDEDEHLRFGVEGMEGQCLIALDRRILVVKPGSAVDETYSGLVTSIHYSAIVNIEVRAGLSNGVIKIHTSDYHFVESYMGQGKPESTFFQLDDPDSVPIAKWALKKYKPQLDKLQELVREVKEATQNAGTNSTDEQRNKE